MRSDLAAVTIVALAATFFTSTRADAFCRTTTERAPAGHGSVDGSYESMEPCWTGGKPLYHPAQCLPYRLLAKESPALSNAVLSEALGASFASWTAASPICTPGITAIELAPVPETEIVGFRNNERGRNVIGVAPVWRYDGGGDTLSLATLTFSTETGEIYDVDVELNGAASWSTSGAPTADAADLQTVLTHEIGHMLGFAHSTVAEATMFATYIPGTIDQSSLAEDDQRAICTVYPTRGQRLGAAGLVASTACNLAQGGPGSCGDAEVTRGCATTPGRRGEGLGAAIAIAIGVLVSRRARRASRPR